MLNDTFIGIDKTLVVCEENTKVDCELDNSLLNLIADERQNKSVNKIVEHKSGALADRSNHKSVVKINRTTLKTPLRTQMKLTDMNTIKVEKRTVNAFVEKEDKPKRPLEEKVLTIGEFFFQE